MTNKNKLWLTLVVLILGGSTSFAQIELPRLISQNAVLQRDTNLKLWGWSGDRESVRLRFNGNIYEGTAENAGKWEISLPPQSSGGPHILEFFSSSDTLILNNIVFGDVYLASGQSNMELAMNRLADTYPEEIEAADYPMIRQFLVPDEFSFEEEKDDLSSGSWKAVNAENIYEFSGVGYFFAKSLYEEFQVPIGIINSALGGSPVEAWLDEEALEEFPELSAEHLRWKNEALRDSVTKADQQRSEEWYAEINNKDEGLANTTPWFEPGINRSSWNEVEIPGYVSDDFFKKGAGVAWYAKEVVLPEEPSPNKARLNLGRLVDMDYAYVNGKLVGQTGYQYPPRNYDFDPEILNEGKNEIVVRLINNGGEMGFVEDKPYQLIVENDTIDLKGKWKIKKGADIADLESQTFIRWKPGGLYNAMIAPLKKYPIKGVLWYQGESNTSNPELYSRTFPKLIERWRTHWNQPDLPFLYVQLANFMEKSDEPQESNWAQLREVQRSVKEDLHNTGMAVIMDVGEWNDIHPVKKKEVGERVALQAKKMIYGKNINPNGPEPDTWKVEENGVILKFRNVEEGWKSNGTPGSFTVSDDGKTFYKAQAEILGDNRIKIWSNDVQNPGYVRYGWANNPANANLFNQQDLPMGPFEINLNSK